MHMPKQHLAGGAQAPKTQAATSGLCHFNFWLTAQTAST